jgi:tripartite-type tricarboxylate transporter receptor subunit TctC
MKLAHWTLWLGACLMGHAAVAQTAEPAFPSRPVKIVVPFGAGSGTDTATRLLAQRLEAAFKQSVVVENRPGANGSIASVAVARSAPDGLTLLMGTNSTHGANPGLVAKLGYDPVKDFVPVARTAMQPLALLVNPKVPAQTLPEFVAYAKARPGQVNYGSAGNGGSSHLVPEMFKAATGLFMVHIPYRGSAPAFTDLMAGQVQFMAESIPQAAQYHKQGKVRALAVTSRERNPALPDIPTVMETGIKNFEVVTVPIRVKCFLKFVNNIYWPNDSIGVPV